MWKIICIFRANNLQYINSSLDSSDLTFSDNTTIPDNVTLVENTTLTNDVYDQTSDNTIRLFSIMILVNALAHIVSNYLLFDFCRRASLNIHKAMTTNIINAVMSFFDSHFIGNILNRFSQDLNNIDEQLPYAFRESIRVSFSAAGIITLIGAEDWRYLIPSFVLFFFWA